MNTKNQHEGPVSAEKIIGKVVVTRGGKELGKLGDLIFDAHTGEIVDFTLENPTRYVQAVSLEKNTEGDYLVPYHTVIAKGDFIIIEEEKIV